MPTRSNSCNSPSHRPSRPCVTCRWCRLHSRPPYHPPGERPVRDIEAGHRGGRYSARRADRIRGAPDPDETAPAGGIGPGVGWYRYPIVPGSALFSLNRTLKTPPRYIGHRLFFRGSNNCTKNLYKSIKIVQSEAHELRLPGFETAFAHKSCIMIPTSTPST